MFVALLFVFLQHLICAGGSWLPNEAVEYFVRDFETLELYRQATTILTWSKDDRSSAPFITGNGFMHIANVVVAPGSTVNIQENDCVFVARGDYPVFVDIYLKLINISYTLIVHNGDESSPDGQNDTTGYRFDKIVTSQILSEEFNKGNLRALYTVNLWWSNYNLANRPSYFNCLPIGPELEKLTADFKEPCPGPTHFLKIWSYVFIAVYPLGIPLFCYFSMLSMGVHLIAHDIKCSLLLKSLVMKYASLGSSNSSDTKQLLADCIEDIKITKSMAVNMLVKFEVLELEAKILKESLASKRKHKHKDGESEIQKKGFCSSCITGSVNSGDKDTKTESYIRKQIETESNENPRFLSAQLLKLAQKLLHENTISIPSLSWKEYRDLYVTKQEKLTAQAQEPLPDQATLNDLDTSPIDLKSMYAIHPDLEDDHKWGAWIKIQNSVGTLLMTIPASWKTFNKRKALGGKAFDCIGFLFAAYKVDFWFWEMFEMLRK